MNAYRNSIKQIVALREVRMHFLLSLSSLNEIKNMTHLYHPFQAIVLCPIDKFSRYIGQFSLQILKHFWRPAC